MQPVWLCILWCKQFEETFENAQWRKVEQMQPVWLCILKGRQFEGTFEDTQWEKVKQMQRVWLCILLYKSNLRTHLNSHSRERENKCNQCDYAFSEASTLRANFKRHSGKKTKTNATMHHPIQAILGDIWKHTNFEAPLPPAAAASSTISSCPYDGNASGRTSVPVRRRLSTEDPSWWP